MCFVSPSAAFSVGPADSPCVISATSLSSHLLPYQPHRLFTSSSTSLSASPFFSFCKPHRLVCVSCAFFQLNCLLLHQPHRFFSSPATSFCVSTTAYFFISPTSSFSVSSAASVSALGVPSAQLAVLIRSVGSVTSYCATSFLRACLWHKRTTLVNTCCERRNMYQGSVECLYANTFAVPEQPAKRSASQEVWLRFVE